MAVWKYKTEGEYLQDLPPNVRLEVMRLVCGDKISYGSARVVFEHANDKARVIKIEDGAQSFQNILEWNIWHEVEGTKLEKWFAPCYQISPSGSALIQARTKKIRELPKRLPSFFTDLKTNNFGEFDGRIVCHDYGLSLVFSKYLFGNLKMQTLSEEARRYTDRPRTKT